MSRHAKILYIFMRSNLAHTSAPPKSDLNAATSQSQLIVELTFLFLTCSTSRRCCCAFFYFFLLAVFVLSRALRLFCWDMHAAASEGRPKHISLSSNVSFRQNSLTSKSVYNRQRYNSLIFSRPPSCVLRCCRSAWYEQRKTAKTCMKIVWRNENIVEQSDC